MLVGCYENAAYFKKYARFLHSIKPRNVDIMSWVNANDLVELYANCKGFVATAHDEDFGLAVVEAMASGKPVIAPREGGYKETVVQGKTGLLVDTMNADTLAEAILRVGRQPEAYRQACITRAKEFDVANFIRNIKEHIRSC